LELDESQRDILLVRILENEDTTQFVEIVRADGVWRLVGDPRDATGKLSRLTAEGHEEDH
jgi:hypothetical protein